MIHLNLFSFTLVFWISNIILWVGARTDDLNVLMPNARPSFEDEYLCHGVKLDKTGYIVGFKPSANKKFAHHMLLYTCEEPGSDDQLWNCGEMGSKGNVDSNVKVGPVCSKGFEILFSWAMGAGGYKLPNDVSFMVGKSTKRKYLVLQAHYKNVDHFKSDPSNTDSSGLILHLQNKPTSKLASLYILDTNGYIPPKATVYMEAACRYEGPGVLHPFAFRVHTHKLGRLVTGYVIHNDKWIEIGKKSPQEEQMFYPTVGGLEVKPGDSLAARCIMTNNQTNKVNIGATQNDEMCNFYFMYWQPRLEAIERAESGANNDCSSMGYPTFSWKKVFTESEIPASASTTLDGERVIDEVNEEFQQTEKNMERVLSDIFGFDVNNRHSLSSSDSIDDLEEDI